jgi:hypothetical protein
MWGNGLPEAGAGVGARGEIFLQARSAARTAQKFTGSVTLVVHKIQRSQRRIALQLWICQEDAALCTSNSGSATLLISVKGSTALISYISGFE